MGRELAAARAGLRSGDTALAVEALEALVPLWGADGPVEPVVEALRLAVRAGSPELRLHFALRWFVRAPGDSAAHRAVKLAALHHPDVADSGRRIGARLASIQDWLAIARADRYATWPELEALGPDGRNGAWDVAQAERLGRVDRDGTPWLVRGARVTRQGRSVAVGVAEHEGGPPHFVPAVSIVNGAAAFSWIGDRPPSRSGRVVVAATSHRFSGYWHWLYDGLVQLVDLQRRGVLEAADRVVVCLDDEAPRLVHDSIAAVGLDPSRIELTTQPFDLEVDELVLVNRRRRQGGMVDVDEDLAARHTADRGERRLERLAIAHLRAHLQVPDTPGRRRLYVSRADACKRRVRNEEELTARLADLGFEVVTLTGRSFEDQVDLFGQAEAVVGPHGAGLTNLMFSPPGTALVELQLGTDPRPHFEALAGQVGARYAQVVCPRAPDSRRDMVADVDQIDAVLVPMLAH